MAAFDHSLCLLINANPDSPLWAVDLGRLVAKQIIYLIPMLLVSMWLWGRSLQRNTALQALLTTAIALGANQLIGLWLPLDRPFVDGLGTTLLAHAPTPSFPSNHYTIFLCVGIALLRRHQPIMGVVLVLTGTVVAWSRIFVGIHYPSDMLGAIVVALASHAAISPFWQQHGDALTHHCQRLYRRVLAIPIAAGWLKR